MRTTIEEIEAFDRSIEEAYAAWFRAKQDHTSELAQRRSFSFANDMKPWPDYEC